MTIVQIIAWLQNKGAMSLVKTCINESWDERTVWQTMSEDVIATLEGQHPDDETPVRKLTQGFNEPMRRPILDAAWRKHRCPSID